MSMQHHTIAQKMTNEERRMINDCLDPRRVPLLDDWEYRFLKNLKTLSVISHNQRRKLTAAWDRVTEEG